MTISKNLHFFWWQGWDKLPAKYVSRVQSVIDHNPGWTVYKWDAQNVRGVIKSIGNEYLKKLDSFTLMHQMIDFSRICALYVFGGASIDTDATAHQGFDALPFIDTSDFICSQNSSSEIENIVKAGIPEVLINATILVKPKHHILKSYLDYMLGLSCLKTESSYSCLQATTGPKSFTKYLLDNYKDQIIILPNQFLDPCNGNDEECQLPPSVVLNQNQEGSWANPNYKKVARVWYFLKRRWMSVVIVLAIIIIFIILSSKK